MRVWGVNCREGGIYSIVRGLKMQSRSAEVFDGSFEDLDCAD